ncbi:hypothetical protein DdX_19232 [Ditylenchus destructor]|uniref:Uncharacterized protein n=1 Tax=Ditylenchus destructor TaxID=166010 RepID=A0AAD4MJQ7_9BILA|nr:hypothetical protein DdX_19232 [Ditylenchus destructor]
MYGSLSLTVSLRFTFIVRPGILQANDEEVDERIGKSDNPEHSVAGIKLFFYHWYTVQAIKMLANDPNSELNTRVEIIRERLEKDSVYTFENAVRESPRLYKPEKGETSWLSPIGVEYVNDVWSNNPTKVRLHSISIELNGAKPITIQELRENLKNNASLIEEIRKGLGKNLGLNFSGDMQFIKPDGKEGPPCKGHVIRCLEDAGHRVNAIDADHPPVLVIYAPKKIKTD